MFMVCDHINRNKLDNRFENLRIVTKRENCNNVDNSVVEFRREIVKLATAAAALKPRSERQKIMSITRVGAINLAGTNRQCGEDNYKSRKVIDLTSGLIFDSIKACADCYGINYSTLRSKLNGSNPNDTRWIVI
jgi:hypothetical protein